jgi:molybdopterin adenylyltransferase
MIRVAIITVSDSVVAGTRQDLSGPALAQRVSELGWHAGELQLVPDETEMISNLLENTSCVDLILTTGGTGVALRDRTPEATRAIADREVPGFGELMRSEGLKNTPFASLSRSSAFTLGNMLIINLPGSPKGALESLEAVHHLIPHAIDLLHGLTQH